VQASRLLGELRPPRISRPVGPAAGARLFSVGDPSWLVGYYEALARISNATRKPLRAATLESLDEAATRWIRLFVGLIEGTRYEMTAEMTVQIPTDGEQPDQNGLMENVAVAIPMRLDYDGATYEVSPAIAQVAKCLAVSSHDQRGTEDGATLCDLHGLEGSQVTATLRWPGPSSEGVLALAQPRARND